LATDSLDRICHHAKKQGGIIAMKRWLIALAAGISLFGPAALGEDTYLDNRSTAQSLVRSFYNAVNLHQYARAYDYFANPPAKDFETFQKGFEDTAHVDVLIGDAVGDGAAGSIFYSVQTAIKAKGTDGKIKFFAGCYTVRAINDAIQEPPSRPFQIDKASLKPIKEDDYRVYALPKCSDQAAEAAEPADTTDAAKARFVEDMAGQCDKTAETEAGANEPAVFLITYHPKGSDKSEPDTKVTLYVFECSMAAYNASEVFYIFDALGLHRLSFAEPHMDIIYKSGSDDSSKLQSMKVDGFTAAETLINAEFDEKTNSISSFSKWRGIGDASSNGTWVFEDGQFVLKDYDVDPTYDEEQNAITVMQGGKIKLAP
jgi:hypothetical protein